MDANNQEFNFNNSYSLMNQQLLEMLKSNYKQLADIKINNNVLFYKDQSFPLGYFRLNQLTVMVCEMPPQEFFQIVKLLANIENNLSIEQQYLAGIDFLVNKATLQETEKKILLDFINSYIELNKYEDFLTDTSDLTLSKYRQVINSVLYKEDKTNLTEGQKLINDQVLLAEQNRDGRANSMTRKLTNPDAPSILADDQNFSKSGFASILFIIYSLINAAIILAIHLVK